MNQKMTAQSQEVGKQTGQKPARSLHSTKLPDHPFMKAQNIIGNHGLLNHLGFPVIQAKLKIGQPNDVYEQEADRMADAVMKMPDPQVQRKSPWEDPEEPIQMKPAAGESATLVQRKSPWNEDEEDPIQMKSRREEDEDEPIQMKSGREEDEDEPILMKNFRGQTSQISPKIESKIHSIKGGGEPLPISVRSFFEPRFGYDLKNVKIHSDDDSAQISTELGAQAFTYRNGIYFNRGKYNPLNTSSKYLIAHELTHVLQQTNQSKNINQVSPIVTLMQVNKIQCFGEMGHELVTEKGLNKMFSKTEMKEIQFGNWKTDMNQISLAIEPLKKAGITLTNSDCVEIVSILAIDKFGEKIGGSINASTLGKYLEAEHFDNPNKVKENNKVQSFFKNSTEMIIHRLSNVVKLGNTSSGRELLGNTLHIIQDIYAHSNFVEIALNIMGKPIDTMGGKSSSGDLIMTSGTFSNLDTAISIAKIIAEKLKEPAKKGEKLSAGTRIAIIILNRNGYRSVTEAYLESLTAFNKGKKAIINEVPEKVRGIVGALINKFELAFEIAKEWLFNKIGDAINEITNEVSNYTGGDAHPSHSKLAKDSSFEKRKLFSKAALLAFFVTQKIVKKVKDIWALKRITTNKSQVNNELNNLSKMVIKFTDYPSKENAWWNTYLKI